MTAAIQSSQSHESYVP